MRKRAAASQVSIAGDLGLSQALVSKVLNGKRERIDPATYDAIWAHALKVGYRPKGMTPHTTVAAVGNRQIGLVLRAGLQPFMPSNFFSHVQAGLHQVLQARGYAMVVLGTEDEIDLDRLGPLPGGLVVLGAVKPAFVRLLRTRTRRLVAINGVYPGLCHTVVPNETQSAELLIEHLAGLGHRRFGWIGGLPGYPSHAVRFEAVQAALAARHLPGISSAARIDLVEGADRQEGRLAVQALLARSGPTPTAIIAFNGVMARGAAHALLQDGWKLPGELSLAAIDATRVCVEEEPHITCASSVPEKLGEAAAQLLLESTGREDEDYRHLVISARLQPGATTGPAPRK